MNVKPEPIHEYESGARRSDRRGKGRFDLLPPYGIWAVARVYEDGAEQKGDRNWEKGQPLSRFLDSALRHMLQELACVNNEPHAAQAVWNLLGFIETKHRIELGELPAELNDLPRHKTGYWPENGKAPCNSSASATTSAGAATSSRCWPWGWLSRWLGRAS